MEGRAARRARLGAGLALAALLASSGCAALIDIGDEPLTVETDGGGKTDAGSADATMGTSDGGGGGGDSGEAASVSQDTGTSDGSFDPCHAPGWSLDCDFGEGGLLTLPVPDGAAVEGGKLFTQAPVVAVEADGTVTTVVTVATEDVLVYSTGAGTSSWLFEGAGVVKDARQFGSSPLLLLTTFNGSVSVSGVIGGSIVASDTIIPTSLPSGIGGRMNTQVVASRILSLDPSLDASTARAAFVAMDPTATANIGGFVLSNPPGDAGAVVEVAVTIATLAGGVAIDVPRGTWMAVDGLTILQVPTTQIIFVADGGSVVGPMSCVDPLGETTDLTPLGEQTALGLAMVNGGDSGLELYELSPDDAGTCNPIVALPTSAVWVPTFGTFYPDDVGLTIVTSGSAAGSNTDPLQVVGLARLSTDGGLDPEVGAGGSAFYVLPGSSTVGRGALGTDSLTLYVPVTIGTASVGLLRFKRTPETP